MTRKSYYILSQFQRAVHFCRPVCFFFVFVNERVTVSNLELGHTLRAAEVEDVPLW